jgi:hypothetical protein
MAPYSIFTVGPNGHFVSVKEIMASSDAAALERARQLLDQLDLEVWSGGRKIAGLSARRRTPAEASWAGSAGPVDHRPLRDRGEGRACSIGVAGVIAPRRDDAPGIQTAHSAPD